MINRNAIHGLVLAAVILSPAQALANTSQQNLFPHHDYSQFTLPAAGDAQTDVLQRYGQPANRKQGSNGVQMWDYGSFRVMFRDSTVSYAAMW